ncbi:hypothetical protein FOA52_002144 [Chlamydomonas sp. UWO 241]|nr:hypothetical protein FOA52_002144 [Chlamydomonas sp. UWO 241]
MSPDLFPLVLWPSLDRASKIALRRVNRSMRGQAPPPASDGDLVFFDMPLLNSTMAATLQVIDVSGFYTLNSIDFVRSCVQLRCLWMAGCFGVSGLSPLAACSDTLEELWMADDYNVVSLIQLKTCTRPRKLALHGCDEFELHKQVEKTCS